MASPFLIDHPSPPFAPSAKNEDFPQPRSSMEAFPEFPSSPTDKSSPASFKHNRTSSYLGVPGAQSSPQRPTRQVRSTSQRFPPTALLPSKSSSHLDLSTPTTERDRDEQPQQRLPRALPAPSLSGPSIRPTSSIAPGLLRNGTSTVNRQQANAEELKSESLWADMQRTLADVELSAMSSSQLFNPQHSRALEKLRETQLALAQAWARSEADETVGQESEDGYLSSEPEGGMQAGKLALRTGVVDGSTQTRDAKGKVVKEPSPKTGEKQPRKGSASSNIGKDLEEETERDIKLARKRRQANDHYFSQVNRGVLDVVARLDEVANAMRVVEKESRAVWEEMGADGSTTVSATDLDGDTDGSERVGSTLMKQLTKATTTTGTGSGTEVSDSQTSPKGVSPKTEKFKGR